MKRAEISLSVVAIIIAVFTLLFGDNIYEQVTGRSIADEWRNFFTPSTETPLETSLESTPTSLVVPTENNETNEQVFFQENFEDSSADGFEEKVGLWTIASETNGNKVFEINTMGDSKEYPTIRFGKSNWKDFIFNAKVNIVDYSPSNDAPLASIIFRENYKIAFTPYWNGFDLVFDPPWTIIAGRTSTTQKNTWYSIRIEAQGPQINVYRDDELAISEMVTRDSSGLFGFGVWPNTHVQFDDITIVPLNK